MSLGNDSFVLPPQNFAEMRGVSYSDDIVVADMNSDGFPDIFTQGGGGPPYVFYASVLLGSAAGNFTGTTILVDHTAPIIPQLTTPTGSIDTNQTNITFSAVDTTVGGVVSGLSSIHVSLDGAPFAAATSPLTYTNLAEGAHTFQIEAVDKAGNVSPVVSRSWIVDLTKPTLSVSFTPPAITASSVATFVFVATDPVSTASPRASAPAPSRPRSTATASWRPPARSSIADSPSARIPSRSTSSTSRAT